MKDLKIKSRNSLETIAGFNVETHHISAIAASIAMSASLEDFNAPTVAMMPLDIRNKVRYIGYGLFEHTNISTEQIAELEQSVFEFVTWRKKVADGTVLESFRFSDGMALESLVGITSNVNANTLNSLSNLRGRDYELLNAVSDLYKLHDAETKKGA